MSCGLTEVLLMLIMSLLQNRSQLSCAKWTQPGPSTWQRDQLGSGSCILCRCRDVPELMCLASWHLMAQTSFERHCWCDSRPCLPCMLQLRVWLSLELIYWIPEIWLCVIPARILAFFLSVKDPHVLKLKHVLCKVMVSVPCWCVFSSFSLQMKKLYLLQHV